METVGKLTVYPCIPMVFLVRSANLLTWTSIDSCWTVCFWQVSTLYFLFSFPNCPVVFKMSWSREIFTISRFGQPSNQVVVIEFWIFTLYAILHLKNESVLLQRNWQNTLQHFSPQLTRCISYYLLALNIFSKLMWQKCYDKRTCAYSIRTTSSGWWSSFMVLHIRLSG